VGVHAGTRRDDVDDAAREGVMDLSRVAARYESEEVAERYDDRRFGGIGGRYNNWRLHRLLRRIMKRLPRGATVLDIPCGTGRIDDGLLAAHLRVVAADISTAMLSVAQRKVRPTSSWLGFLRTDAGCLPFRDGGVDVTVSIRFVHLFDRPTRLGLLGEIARVTNDRVVLEYRNVDSPYRAATRAIRRWMTGRCQPAKRAMADVAAELTAAGLELERIYFVSQLFSASVLIVARRPRRPC
jgi:ubiquinone/menaquinone biosynthesis C-methylase UbiE